MKLVPIALALAGIPAGIGPAAPAPPVTAALQAIPLDVNVPFVPPPVFAEGWWHIVYELHLANYGRGDLLLERVDVSDAAGATLLSLGGDALGAALAHPGSAATGDRKVLPGGQHAVLFLDVAGPPGTAVPRGLRHRLTFRPVMTVDGTEQRVVEPNPVSVARANTSFFGPPLEGGCWVASHGLSNASSHRRTIIAVGGAARIAQRFAIDWIRVGADGQAFRGDPSHNRNWAPYGANVLAVADGRVVEALDGIPENDPTADRKAVPITLTTVGGNHILLDVGHGRYVLYAHLQPGSLQVHAKQRVRRGQVIARLGNTGQSDAPHLHVHVVDAPSPLAAEGLPLPFQSFLLQGHLPSLGVLTDGTGWHPSAPAQRRRGEMPLENAVVRFPGGESGCG